MKKNGERDKTMTELSQFENGYASGSYFNLVTLNQNRNDTTGGVVIFDGLNRLLTQRVLFAVTHGQPEIDPVD